MTRMRKSLFGGAILALACSMETPARAESIIKNPGDHPAYKFELEPHLDFGWAGLFAGSGFGGGVRGSVVIVQNGFVPSINNSVAISFGLDLLRYGGCYAFRFDNRGCGATFLEIPVALQWNFWLSPQWSVFGEPGLYIYHGFFDDFCDTNRFPGCRGPSATGVEPAFWAGGRFHFNDKIALTMRIGYPTFSIGASFLF